MGRGRLRRSAFGLPPLGDADLRRVLRIGARARERDEQRFPRGPFVALLFPRTCADQAPPSLSRAAQPEALGILRRDPRWEAVASDAFPERALLWK
jgi:hypothetical protein